MPKANGQPTRAERSAANKAAHAAKRDKHAAYMKVAEVTARDPERVAHFEHLNRLSLEARNAIEDHGACAAKRLFDKRIVAAMGRMTPTNGRENAVFFNAQHAQKMYMRAC